MKERIENSLGRNGKNKSITYISTNNISEINELIYAGAKLVGEKIGIPSKGTKKNQNQDGKFDWKRRWKIHENRSK